MHHVCSGAQALAEGEESLEWKIQLGCQNLHVLLTKKRVAMIDSENRTC